MQIKKKNKYFSTARFQLGKNIFKQIKMIFKQKKNNVFLVNKDPWKKTKHFQGSNPCLSLVFKDLLIGKYCSDTGVETVRPVPDAILNNKQTYRVATLLHKIP